MLLAYQNTNIEYDPQGGFWFVQNRTNDPLAATMLHYNYKSGVIDREEHAAKRTSGGVRHNHNFTNFSRDSNITNNIQITISAEPY